MATKSTTANNTNLATIKGALKALECIEKLGGMERVKKAVKYYDMTEKFFKLKGRFKCPYKRKSPTKKSAAKTPKK